MKHKPLLMRHSACRSETGTPLMDVIQSMALEIPSNGDMHLHDVFR
jgi:hypothetical protein